MIEIIIYSFSVMYTPGPVNAISLNCGVQKQKTIFPFCLGISFALFMLLSSVSLIGEKIISESMLQWMSILGSIYVFWLAIKIFYNKVSSQEKLNNKTMSFRDGFSLQLLNPKGFVVALPIATVQFPSAGITGGYIFVWCIALSLLGFGAPLIYYIFGKLIRKNISEVKYLNVINKIFAIFLLLVSLNMVLTFYPR